MKLKKSDREESKKSFIGKYYTQAFERIKNIHIGCFGGMDKPLLLISEQYPGLWIEHVYDSVLWAQLESSYLDIAENAINLFVDRQLDNGQLPFAVMDLNKRPDLSEVGAALYSQIQECVSFFTLALEVYEMNKNSAFLEKAYNSGKKWDEWLRKYRMTTNRGLIEMFVGYDTGHDNSGRLFGIGCRQSCFSSIMIQSLFSGALIFCFL